MGLFELVLVALALSGDCLAVSVGAGASSGGFSRWQVLRVAFFFGLFQFLMPLVGWSLGSSVVEFIAAYDHWVAFAILSVVAGRLIHESFGAREEHPSDISRGVPLLVLSVATSIDALAVGLSLAFLNSHIVRASVLIGIVAFVATVVGLLAGSKAGELLGRRARLAGGVVLLAVALRIVITHLAQGM
ncbi:MAG: manganese efflux pump MntP family protein [Chloroflexota bacterium]